MTRARNTWLALPVLAILLVPGLASAQDEIERNFAGSVQLNYMALASDVKNGRKQTLTGSTVELSMKLAMDFGEKVSGNIKVCYACHGFEAGMALFDIRVHDSITVRVGRFTPAFGEFPLRHDPANHQTSDKPLPYDMGRMLRLREWNMSILPTPWVDNGIEVSGTHFFGDHMVDYAAYLVSGPRANADPLDFDFIQSRSGSSYYVDNNDLPSGGGRIGGTLGLSEDSTLSLGLSAMGGHYDPDTELSFLILGADLVMRLNRTFIRAEAIVRRTEMAIGERPESRFRYGPGEDGTYADYFVKEGFYTEIEHPLGKDLTLIGRWDGMRRRGNVADTSPLRSKSVILRYTAGLSYGFWRDFRIKSSVEAWDFSDFSDEVVLHLGIAGPF